MTHSKSNLIDPTIDFFDDSDAALVVRQQQDITQEYLDDLKDKKYSKKRPGAEYHRLASIPTVIVEKWKREGFDIFDQNVKAADIIKRLQREDLTYFIQ